MVRREHWKLKEYQWTGKTRSKHQHTDTEGNTLWNSPVYPLKCSINGLPTKRDISLTLWYLKQNRLMIAHENSKNAREQASWRLGLCSFSPLTGICRAPEHVKLAVHRFESVPRSGHRRRAAIQELFPHLGGEVHLEQIIDKPWKIRPLKLSGEHKRIRSQSFESGYFMLQRDNLLSKIALSYLINIGVSPSA